MNQVIQTCTQKGHEHKKVKYACIDAKCEKNRMLCSQCLLQNIHKHGSQDNNHILNQQGIEMLIQQQLHKLREIENKDQVRCNQFVQRTITFIKKIQEQVQVIVNMLKQLQDCSFYQDKIKWLDEILSSINNQKLNQIDNQFIKSLITDDIKQSRFPQIYLINSEWDNMSKNIQSSKSLSKLWNQQEQIQVPNIIIAKYRTTLIDQSEDYIYTATQSSDLKYIVSGGTDCILKIWNYLNLKLIIQRKLDSWIMSVRFTDDSQLLYVGMFIGVLYCFDVSSGFKQFYKQQIHKDRILSLYCITNTTILTASLDKTIIKTDIQLNQQIFLIKDQDNLILGFDYQKLKNIIVSSSDDNSIKLWDNSNGSLLMQKEQATKNYILQVLLLMMINCQVQIIKLLTFGKQDIIKKN